MLRGIGRLRAGNSGFNPRSALWPLGTEAGLWLDQSDGATVFQESSGLTAGVVNSPTGLRLDKRFGLALGPEIVIDGGFSNAGSWTQETNWVVAGGVATSTASTDSRFCYQTPSVTLVAGEYWEVTFTINSISAGGVYVEVGGSTTIVRTAPGTYTQRLSTVASRQLIGLSCSLGSPTTTAVVDNLSVKKVLGNHVSQATAAARPTWKLNGAIYSDLDDGTDDGYATAAFVAGTLTADMDCFIAIKRNSAAKAALCYAVDGFGDFFCVFDPAGGAAVSHGNSGTPTQYVNGVAVAGGTGTTRVQLDAALPNGTWVVWEARNLNLSGAGWTKFSIANYITSSFQANADIGGLILCPAQTASVRNQIRTYLGNKVGLSL